jgi:hypothetical protein
MLVIAIEMDALEADLVGGETDVTALVGFVPVEPAEDRPGIVGLFGPLLDGEQTNLFAGFGAGVAKRETVAEDEVFVDRSEQDEPAGDREFGTAQGGSGPNWLAGRLVGGRGSKETVRE